MYYSDAIRELRGARYCNRQLIRINQDLEVLRHQQTGLARSGPDLTPEQARSSLPMPHYHGSPDRSPVALIEAITAKEREAQTMRLRILDIRRWLERLKPEDQQAMIEIYLLDQPYEETAARLGYTKKGLWKHLRSEAKKIGIE